jgi:hypothetical protein
VKLIRALFLVLLATSAQADSREDLIVSIETAGSNEYEDERHRIEIDGCQMTTYRWRLRPDHGWVLWTSFRFDMVHANLVGDSRNPQKKSLYAAMQPGPPEIGLTMIAFTMRDGFLARQERSVLREASEATESSPRGDGTTHYYQYLDDFFFMMQGPSVEPKGPIFAEGYERYVRDYCTFSS